MQKTGGITQNTEAGQAALIAVILLTSAMLVVVGGFANLALEEENIVRTSIRSSQSYFSAEAGQEDAIYRVVTARTISDEEELALGGATTTTAIADVAAGKDVSARGDYATSIRAVYSLLSESDGASFNYGVQAGEGGFEIQNLSSVEGNVYANGPIVGSSWNDINGTVISAGPDGYIEEISASNDAYANTIADSIIDGDAYFQSITGTVVLGTEYPGSSDQPTSTLPISDETIDQWKAAAEAGGTITCSDGDEHEIDDDTTIGPAKIPCDLDIGFVTVTLTGAVWVEGDIDIHGFANIEIDSALSGKSVPLIADEPNDPSGGGRVDIRNLVDFEGASGDSYVLVVSQNTSAEEGGGEEAIRIRNGTEGDLLAYAPHGELLIENLTSLKEASAYKIVLKNLAQIEYEGGLANLLFETGPSGGYGIVDWKEVE